MKQFWFFLTMIFLLFTFISTGFTVTNNLTMVDNNYEPVSDQVWAIDIFSDPGSEGSLAMDYEAANGSFDDRDDEDYAGNYFNIEQQVSVTSGETKRYIDISSPDSHGYLMEDMTVTGRTDIVERFSMENMTQEPKTSHGWWDLF
ncbi:MAG: hypothetical protein AVO34_05820 [Firmicutes bacterium ML8_F2]|jgi:hypothetical protein|nr:MAG: hypothetical protein AVO34_05820 [Firmicutes bacterium ML8_F2]